MRSVDLFHYDPLDDVDLATVCDLMATIEQGHTDLADFQISEPGEGGIIVYVSGVVLSQSNAHAWTICRRRGRNQYFLGLGDRRDYYECVYLGAPEQVRADCLLSMDDAVASIEKVVDSKKVSPPLHWVSLVQALERLKPR
jgi:hypothetical protein